MTSQLDELVSLISSAADYIKKEYQHHGTPVLSLDETQEHPYDTAHVSREFQHALRTLQGACAQLSTLVTPPSRTLNAVSLLHVLRELRLISADGPLRELYSKNSLSKTCT